jgi:hypothetical protein
MVCDTDDGAPGFRHELYVPRGLSRLVHVSLKFASGDEGSAAVLLGSDTALPDSLIEGRAADAKDARNFGDLETELR